MSSELSGSGRDVGQPRSGPSLANVMLPAVFSRSLISISLLIAFAATTAVGSGTSDYPEPKGYVNDYGNGIDVDTRARLNALCAELDQTTHAQVAIVTIETLHGALLEHYATSLFNKWGIGHKDDNRGILVLLVLSDRKYRIEIGRGFEALFPDERVAKIGAEMVPDLKLRHYSQALLRCTRTLAMIVAQERGVTLHELNPSPRPNTH
jgi:uncharacterized protein